MSGQTIVVFVHHGLGDLLMAIPLLRSCDDALAPGGRLVLFVKSRTEARLLELIPWRSRVLVRTLARGGMLGSGRLLRMAFRLRACKPTALLAPHATDGIGMALLSAVIGARCSIGPEGRWSRIGFSRRVASSPGTHKVRLYLRFGEAIGLPAIAEPDIRVPVPAGARAQAARRLRRRSPGERWVAIAPGSGVVEAHKRWPPPLYRSLLAKLVALSPEVRIGLFGPPSEWPLLRSLTEGESALADRAEIFAESDVGKALALLGHFDVLVTGCCGAGHMAAAVGLPVVALFGPTDPASTAPFTPKLRVLRAGLPCSPCYRKGFISGCGAPVCMSRIDPEDVFGAVLGWLRDDQGEDPRACLAAAPN
jgi:ADP-heptose:LPS heptosyltransferase